MNVDIFLIVDEILSMKNNYFHQEKKMLYIMFHLSLLFEYI